jgi:hypothetical protein
MWAPCCRSRMHARLITLWKASVPERKEKSLSPWELSEQAHATEAFWESCRGGARKGEKTPVWCHRRSLSNAGGEGAVGIKDIMQGIGADSVLEYLGRQESMLQALRCCGPAWLNHVGVPHRVEFEGKKQFYRGTHSRCGDDQGSYG